ncbi:transposase, partial [Escherichia coli]
VQLHQQKGMISLSPPTICNSALSYNLFLLFKFDSLDSSEYRQQIKTFRLKYVFLAAKIIKTARYVIMKLSENYPYKGVYEKCLV